MKTVVVKLLHPETGWASPSQVYKFAMALVGVCFALDTPGQVAIGAEEDVDDLDVAACFVVPVRDRDQGDAVLHVADVLAQAIGCGFAGAGTVEEESNGQK